MQILLTVLPYLIGAGLLAVVITLFTGFSTLGSGEGSEGMERRRRSNRLMMLRVGLQAGTVVLFLLYVALMRWGS
jgi:hypothetical protein